MEYLLGTKSIVPYRCIYVIVAFLGVIPSLNIVWDIADTLNALMTIPNLIAVLLLSGVIVADTRKYLKDSAIDLTDTEPVPQWTYDPNTGFAVLGLLFPLVCCTLSGTNVIPKRQKCAVSAP